MYHKAGLSLGREIRKRQLQNWKKEIPSINQIITKNHINLEIWFDKYLKLINYGYRKFKKIEKKGNKINIEYYNYSNSKKVLFRNSLPKKIKINKEFQYFFGLWCGDRIGKGRFGVVNQNKEIIFFTDYYLKKLYQTPKIVLMVSPKCEVPEYGIKVNQTLVYSSIKSYGYYVYSQNNTLFTFFDYLYQNLDYVLSNLPNKNIFFAGLFDAEGNVFLEDKCVRWSCKTKRLIKIYVKYLKELHLYDRYDGYNFVAYNLLNFLKLVYPFIKHKGKVNNINLLFNCNGELSNRFLIILTHIYNNPGEKVKDVAKALKRVKLYAQIRFLEDYNYVHSEGYPKTVYLTIKGLKELI